MDTEHLQEFIKLKFYMLLYWNFEDTIVFFQNLLKMLYLNLLVNHYRGNELNFDGNWDRITIFDAMKEILGDDFLTITDPNALKEVSCKQATLFTMADMAEYKSISQII